MTTAALARIVIGGRVRQVARQAEHKARMIEGRGQPAGRRVTRTAFAGIMIDGLIGGVTGGAGRLASVIE